MRVNNKNIWSLSILETTFIKKYCVSISKCFQLICIYTCSLFLSSLKTFCWQAAPPQSYFSKTGCRCGHVPQEYPRWEGGDPSPPLWSSPTPLKGEARFLILLLLPLLLPTTRCLCWQLILHSQLGDESPHPQRILLWEFLGTSISPAWMCILQLLVLTSLSHPWPSSRLREHSVHIFSETVFAFLNLPLCSSQNPKGPICPFSPVQPPTFVRMVRSNVLGLRPGKTQEKPMEPLF